MTAKSRLLNINLKKNYSIPVIDIDGVASNLPSNAERNRAFDGAYRSPIYRLTKVVQQEQALQMSNRIETEDFTIYTLKIVSDESNPYFSESSRYNSRCLGKVGYELENHLFLLRS